MKNNRTSAPDANAGLLAIDVRNAATRFGLFAGDEERPFATWSISTPPSLTVDEAKRELHSFFAMAAAGIATAPGSGATYGATTADAAGSATASLPGTAIVASVVPMLTDTWSNAARFFTRTRTLVVGPGLKTGIPMRYNDPAHIGADRIANIAAVVARQIAPALVIDLGTTTNIEVIDQSGGFCGGVIAPGIDVSARAVSESAAKLTQITMKAPKSIIGKNTDDAVRSGIVMGEVARIDGLVAMIWDELGTQTPIIMTGHGASGIAALSSLDIEVESDLTLSGLRTLALQNKR